MTEEQVNDLLRKAVEAWGGEGRVRQSVIETFGDDAAEDVAAIDHAMQFVHDWLQFVAGLVEAK